VIQTRNGGGRDDMLKRTNVTWMNPTKDPFWPTCNIHALDARENPSSTFVSSVDRNGEKWRLGERGRGRRKMGGRRGRRGGQGGERARRGRRDIKNRNVGVELKHYLQSFLFVVRN
jgi:hypothetical protein